MQANWGHLQDFDEGVYSTIYTTEVIDFSAAQKNFVDWR